MPRSVSDIWIKGSDITFGNNDIIVIGTTNYINPIVDYAPLSSNDPALKLEPSPSTATTETTRFTRYILLTYTSQPKTVLVTVGFSGTGHIYNGGSSVTFYYRLYAKLTKTSDFSTFTDATSETTIWDYSTTGASTSGWYDQGTIQGTMKAKVTLNAGEALLLVLRGTSWSGANQNSHGINSSNFKVAAAVLV